MQAFAELLDRLVLTPSRNGKLKLMTDYFAATPTPTGVLRWPHSQATCRSRR